MSVPRLRMFAGPNGSGKSTIKGVLRDDLLGIYLNPDDLEKRIDAEGSFDPAWFGVEAKAVDVLDHLRDSDLGRRTKSGLLLKQGKLVLDRVRGVDSYLAAALAEFLRGALVRECRSFTFETVMSSRSKVELLRLARDRGFRTYLYFVATEDPAINVSRVANRVLDGGHDVPTDKIVDRYARSLDLLLEAIRNSDRAYIFDNSTEERVWIAEITEGRHIDIRSELVPDWFHRSVIERL